MKFRIVALAVAAIGFGGCDRGQTVKGPSDELKRAIEFDAALVGKAGDQYRDMDLIDYEVSITNNWKSSVFLTRSNPTIHSDYIVKRNPEAINYMTSGISGARHLSSRGISGSGTTREIKVGESISFIAPMPVIPKVSTAGEFKIRMTIYLDQGLHEGRWFVSEPLPFNPSS